MFYLPHYTSQCGCLGGRLRIHKITAETLLCLLSADSFDSSPGSCLAWARQLTWPERRRRFAEVTWWWWLCQGGWQHVFKGSLYELFGFYFITTNQFFLSVVEKDSWFEAFCHHHHHQEHKKGEKQLSLAMKAFCWKSALRSFKQH